MNRTELYYNTNANEFFASTINADMSSQHNLFEKYLYNKAHILDCGCGSGRDSKYFLEQGYEVTAIDGSEELCKLARKFTGLEVQHTYFQDIDYENEFDGIWACASLLHVSEEELPGIFKRLSKALKDNGVLYVSFKYGDFNGERNGRFFVDMNEESFETLIKKIPALKIQETYISSDVRQGREHEEWLNVVLIKKDNAEIKFGNEVNDIELSEVMDKKGKKMLHVTPILEDVDYEGVLDRVAQYINVASVVDTIQKGTQYVVQIPAKYQSQFETGEFFINKNQTTGIEWPTLVRLGEDGRYKFVDNLPIAEQEFIQGNPFQDIVNNFHNIYMQKQIAALSETVAETYATVKRIEQGQNDDRLALIDAGREEIMLAMCIKDKNERDEHIRLGRHNLLLGKEQIGRALKRRVNAFKAIPENKIKRFWLVSKDTNYHNRKDDEVEQIQECYEMYMEATKMLAASFAYTDEVYAAEQIFKTSVAFIKNIDFSPVKTIEYTHNAEELQDMFFNNAVEYFETEKEFCIEKSQTYDYIALEVSGDKLLEVIHNGRKEKI